jgi:hypothetical protein
MTERVKLAPDDIMTGLQLQAMAAQAESEARVAQQALSVWIENLRCRYNAPDADGWQLERWTDGFFLEEGG